MYIIYYGELILKGNNRNKFEDKLLTNIKKKIPKYKISKKYGKIIIDTQDTKIQKTLSQIPGISHFAITTKTSLQIDQIKNGIDIHLNTKNIQLPNIDTINSFRIYTSRTNKNYELNSQELNRNLGDYINNKYKRNVDLTNPELTIYINISEKEAYVYTNKIQGLKGLPTGSSGKVISLLSGGIDSPVSSFMMMKRGCEVILLHAYNQQIDNNLLKDKIMKLAKQLSQYQTTTKLYLIPYQEIQKEIVQGTNPKIRMILFKRSIIRIAQQIADIENAQAIIIGDSLSQVASQTIENITSIYYGSQLPIFSPLIGMDKEEIVSISQKIGTFEISIIKQNDCCTLISPPNPETKSKLANILSSEQELFLSSIENKAIQECEIINFC